MAQTKKHQPGTSEEPERKPYAFMDSYEFVWASNHWSIPNIGDSWLAILYDRQRDFYAGLRDEFGELDEWLTITNVEKQIGYCAAHPVFSVSPDPIFLRKWLDSWVEWQYCRLGRHVFDVLRLKTDVSESDAAYRAEVIAAEFEALYEPTEPRVPQKPKKRRGSK